MEGTEPAMSMVVAKRGVGDVQVPEGLGEDGIEEDSTS